MKDLQLRYKKDTGESFNKIHSVESALSNFQDILEDMSQKIDNMKREINELPSEKYIQWLEDKAERYFKL